ncbi:MAG: hypothetical protein ABH846_02110 [Patescibacteria group bacterium]
MDLFDDKYKTVELEALKDDALFKLPVKLRWPHRHSTITPKDVIGAAVFVYTFVCTLCVTWIIGWNVVAVYVPLLMQFFCGFIAFLGVVTLYTMTSRLFACLKVRSCLRSDAEFKQTFEEAKGLNDEFVAIQILIARLRTRHGRDMDILDATGIDVVNLSTLAQIVRREARAKLNKMRLTLGDAPWPTNDIEEIF